MNTPTNLSFHLFQRRDGLWCARVEAGTVAVYGRPEADQSLALVLGLSAIRQRFSVDFPAEPEPEPVDRNTLRIEIMDTPEIAHAIDCYHRWIMYSKATYVSDRYEAHEQGRALGTAFAYGLRALDLRAAR